MERESEAVQVGDWVSFTRDGALVIASVAYVKRLKVGFRDAVMLVTSEGQVDEEFVHETRKAVEE